MWIVDVVWLFRLWLPSGLLLYTPVLSPTGFGFCCRLFPDSATSPYRGRWRWLALDPGYSHRHTPAILSPTKVRGIASAGFPFRLSRGGSENRKWL